MNPSPYPVRSPDEIPSPALLYFEEQLSQNLHQTIKVAGSVDRLRPHVKSHKTVGLVRMQLQRGIRKFKCATIAEAEMLVRAGAADILLAYPIVGPNVERVVRFLCLHPAVTLSVLADNAASAARLSQACREFNRRIPVLLDLDPGLHRTGVPIDDSALSIYLEISRLEGIIPAGLHCYDGNNHHKEYHHRLEAATLTYRATMKLKAAIEQAGASVPSVLMGGTPTFPCYASMDSVDLSPGTGFLHDWRYATRFPDLPFTPAALLLARVISRPAPYSFTLDLGHKAIAADPPDARGMILAYPDAESVMQNEEHWVFRAPEPLPEVGRPLLVLPTHICPTSALHQEAVIIDAQGNVTDRWPIAARDRRLFL